MTEELQKKYRKLREHMLSKESTEGIIKTVAVQFLEWIDTSEYVQGYYRFNKIYLEPKMDGSHIERQKEARQQLFDYWLENIYKDE